MELAAVVSGECISRYGERKTCILGGIVSGLGLFVSSFATDPWALIMTYGVIVGVGHSLSLFAGIVLINRVFVKRRAFASGVGTMGGGTGTLLLGVVVPLMVERVGLAWTLRVLGGVVCVGIVTAGMLLTDPFMDQSRWGGVEEEDKGGVEDTGMQLMPSVLQSSSGNSPDSDERGGECLPARMG